MFKRSALTLTAAALTLGLGACATNMYPQSNVGTYPMTTTPAYNNVGTMPANTAMMGTVSQIQIYQVPAQTETTRIGTGALVGGAVGALIGNQINGPWNRTGGTILGAVGGAIAGQVIENRTQAMQYQPQQGYRNVYRVTVRTDDGVMRDFDYEAAPDLVRGERVRVLGNQLYR